MEPGFKALSFAWPYFKPEIQLCLEHHFPLEAPIISPFIQDATLYTLYGTVLGVKDFQGSSHKSGGPSYKFGGKSLVPVGLLQGVISEAASLFMEKKERPKIRAKIQSPTTMQISVIEAILSWKSIWDLEVPYPTFGDVKLNNSLFPQHYRRIYVIDRVFYGNEVKYSSLYCSYYSEWLPLGFTMMEYKQPPLGVLGNPIGIADRLTVKSTWLHSPLSLLSQSMAESAVNFDELLEKSDENFRNEGKNGRSEIEGENLGEKLLNEHENGEKASGIYDDLKKKSPGNLNEKGEKLQ